MKKNDLDKFTHDLFKMYDSINDVLSFTFCLEWLCKTNSTCFIAYYYGKKKSRRVGRPPGGHSNLEGGVKRRGRRRKRRKQLFVHKKRRSSASVDNTPAGSPQVTKATLDCKSLRPLVKMLQFDIFLI